MESIGQTLRQARESRGFSVEQVSRETNISRHYLVALEEDDYEAFPAEPYTIGFLRNYADHLGLNTEELLTRFRTLKIQEQPTPLAALIQKPSPISPKLVLGIAIVVIAGILAIFLVPSFLDLMKSLHQTTPLVQAAAVQKTVELTADKKTLDRRVFVGDTIVIDFNGKPYKFLVKSLGNELTLAGNSTDYKLRLGDTLYLDLDGDTTQDVRFFLKDISPGQADKGAELSIERLGAVTPLAEGLPSVGSENLSNTPAPGSTNVIQEAPIVLQQGSAAKPFSVDVVFHAPALFRYIVDGNLRQENFYNKGQTIHIDADKTAKLFVSNAGAVEVQVNGNDLNLGKNGHVATKILEWTKDATTGNLQLVADPLY
jgi:cytoskeletal protein RodZ